MMKKRMLVVTPRIPFPTVGGDKVRIYNICKGLANDYIIDLLTYSSTESGVKSLADGEVFANIETIYLPKWKRFLQVIFAIPTPLPFQLAYYYSGEMAKKISEKIGDYDVCIAHLLRTGQFLMNEAAIDKTVLEMTDAISLNYKRVRDLRGVRLSLKSVIYRMEYARMVRCEKAAIRKFKKVVVVSEIDKAALDTETGSDRIKVITNGVELGTYQRKEDDSRPNSVLFIGNMGTEPNKDACRYFIDSIFPLVRNADVNIRFKIVGKESEALAKEFGGKADILGYVESRDQILNGVFCGIAPMRIGAGIQNKILDYMAMGIPTVTTTIGYEGLSAMVDRDILVKDNIQEFAESIIRLYKNIDFRHTVGESGRRYAEKNHTWENSTEKYKQCIKQLLET